MYRGTWLIIAIPLLLGAFSVARPTPLAAPFPPAFDAASAATLADDLVRLYPERLAGTTGAQRAAVWFREQLSPYGVRIRTQPFTAEVPGYGELRFENIVTRVRGRSDRRIVVLAHRDDLGIGPGANDNASGTAALIVLARSYATPPGEEDPRQGPAHTIDFVSTDGGALGGHGAAHFAAVDGEGVDAVIVLDAIAGPGAPRLVIAGDEARSPGWTLVRTAAARILEQTGQAPARPSAARQLVDLAFPLTLTEQGPFVGRGIPAVTLTSQADTPVDAVADTRVDEQRLAQLGGAAQTLIGSVDQGLELTRGGSPYLYLGSRVIRGWAVQLVLIAAVLPFLAAAVDLFARCRRRRIPLGPAVRSYASRLGFWLFVGLAFLVLSRVAWPQGDARPVAPETDAATAWPVGAIVALCVIGVGAWIVARDRLIPRRPVTVEEELAGHTAALLVLGLVALLVLAVNAFALVFVLPALHAWLWLPQLQSRSPFLRAAVVLAGFAGPAFLLWSLADRFGLGLDAVAYALELAAIGYVPLPLLVLALAWLAAAAQLTAIAAHRYAPYPAAAERPPRGPLRELVRRMLLVAVERRRASEEGRRALGG
jgi:hypothetical protein